MVVIPHTMAVCLCRPQVSLSQASELVKGEVFLHFYQVGGKQAAHTFMIRGRGDDMTSARCFTSTFSGLKARLSLSHAVCCLRLLLPVLYSCPRGICYLQNATESRAGLHVRMSTRPSLLKLFFFIYCFLFLWTLYIFFFLFFSAQRWGYVIGCVCV